MNLTKVLLAACGLVAALAVSDPSHAQYRPPIYTTPNGFGGYTTTQPSAIPYQPPVYTRPDGFGGYVTTQTGR